MINGHGGDMAPDLTYEGTAVQRDWLVQFLKNPETLRPALIRRMPKFNFTDAEINTLTDYMLTVYQTSEFDRDSIPASELTPAMADQGKQLFYSKFGCQSCHIADFKTDKGYIGPALAGTGKRFNAAWVYHWLKNPQALRPGTAEPNQHMTDEEARSSDCVPDVAESGRRKEMKQTLIAALHARPADGWLLTQGQAAGGPEADRQRRGRSLSPAAASRLATSACRSTNPSSCR